jgi:acetate---CoA ligase (ADP-forming)
MCDSVFSAFFEPRSIVLFGSVKAGKIGYEILKSIREGGYPGRLYPINPAGGEVLGVPVFRSLDEISEQADLAVISLPQRAVTETIIECGKRGIRAVVIISSGFSEVGNDQAEKELAEAARSWKVRLIGPNCAGLMNPWQHHFPSIEVRALPGHTAFVTQSGALGGATLGWAEERGFGFSKFVSYGNRCDVGEIELLSYLGDDPDTRVIVLYIEGIDRGREFLKAAQEASLKKPLIAIKAGRTGAGQRAASSHTGTLAGVDEIYDAAFRKAGILRVEGIEEMFDLCQALSEWSAPAGNRVAIITNSGGPGILAADKAESLGLDVGEPSVSLREALKSHLSPHASLKNPIDLTVESGYEEYRLAVEKALVEYDAALVINVATPYLDSNAIARGIIDGACESGKPVLTNFMAGRIVREAIGILKEAGIVNLDTGERCAFVLSKLVERGRLLRSIPVALLDVPSDPVQDRPPSRRSLPHPLIQKANAMGRHLLEPESLELLEDYGIRTPPHRWVRTKEEAASAAEALGRPAVMKIVSPDIVHKTEMGGVAMPLHTKEDVQDAFSRLVSLGEKGKRIEGVLVTPFQAHDVELFAGMVRDAQFGPVITVGLGGVWIETLKDVAYGIAPLSTEESEQMVRSIRSYSLLLGARGKKRADLDALSELLVLLSRMALAESAIREIDLNPVFPLQKGVFIADARVLLNEIA